MGLTAEILEDTIQTFIGPTNIICRVAVFSRAVSVRLDGGPGRPVINSDASDIGSASWLA